MAAIQDLLHNDLILMATILAIGTLVGRIKVSNVAISASGGVLFVALFFGHFGYSLPDGLATFGFAFFMYSIGFSAGPRFFQSFKKNGLRFVVVAMFVATIACLVSIPLAILFDLPMIVLPGILGGALTSTSTLAAAYELARDPMISVAYGVTYPFGLIGLLLLIQMMTRGMHIDLKTEAKPHDVKEDEEEEEDHEFQKRVYQVQNPGVLGVPLKDLELRKLSGGVGIISIKRDDETFLAHADTILKLHDHVMAEGPLRALLQLEEYIGPEVADPEIIQRQHDTAKVIITRKEAANKKLKDLGLPRQFGVILTRLQRGMVDLPIHPEIKLERGDILTIAGEKERLQHAIVFLGHADTKKHETDIFMFFAGILFGVLLGNIELPLINTSIGNAGGLLLAGILVGYFRHYGYYSGRIPLAARYLLQEIGLAFFLATIGVQAGQGLVAQLSASGLQLFITGVLVTVITLISTLFFCRYVIRFDWNTSFGATTGGVTSTVALKMVTDKAESQYALLGYAGVYAFSNILLTILGQLLIVLAR